MDFNDALNTGRMAAQAGAAVIREQFGQSNNSRVKAESQTLVTDTDIAAEKAIMEILSSHSDYGILSEESGLSGESKGPVWVIDPLDGTSNFARSVPVFAVSVALMHENKVVAGVIIDPVHQKEFYASAGGGAYLNGSIMVQEDIVNAKPVVFVNHGHREADKKRFAEITNGWHLNSIKGNLAPQHWNCVMWQQEISMGLSAQATKYGILLQVCLLLPKLAVFLPTGREIHGMAKAATYWWQSRLFILNWLMQLKTCNKSNNHLP
jgi:hypothetical protein